jgi:hypothetical protein
MADERKTTPHRGINRICPSCGGVRGLRGAEEKGTRLCLLARACMEMLLAEVRKIDDDRTASA